LPVGEAAKATISPTRRFDVGLGNGKEVHTKINGGVVGIIIDCRGRPLVLPEDREERVRKLTEWNRALDVYPNSHEKSEG
jgi:hypothetical protein